MASSNGTSRSTGVEAPPPEQAFVTEDIVSAPAERRRRSLFERAEGMVSKLSSRNNFWHRFCSFVWLPYAFRSGIRMKRVDGETFTYVLPFRRFNRNWYNAMAGASLLANSEIAGGMYVFQHVGRDYTVVCKDLHYRFLRPCFGPAVYQAVPLSNIEELMADGGEFNYDLRLNVYQQLKAPGPGKQKRVGRVNVTFHVTPKVHHKDKKQRRKEYEKAKAAVTPQQEA